MDRAGLPGKLHLLLGPAASGKTHQLLGRYHSELVAETAQGRLGTLLWLTPSHRARQATRDQLALLGTGIMAPNVHTFEEFAEKLLLYAPTPVTPINRSSVRVLLRRIVGRMAAEGKLHAYRAIAETSGFLDLVSGMIAELKQEEIWPDQFLSACSQFEDRIKDQEIAEIYDRYQHILLQAHWYDEEGRFWFARQLTEQGIWGPFPRFRLVVLDGFTDFLGTQIQFLKTLLGHTEEMIVSFPAERSAQDAQPRRDDLFAKTGRAVQRIKTLGPFSVEWKEEPEHADALPAGIRRIATDLFLNLRQIEPINQSAGVEFWALSGAHGEVRHVTQRVRQLLSGGTSPDEIVVATRSLADYAGLLQEAFDQAAIPFTCDHQVKLRTMPFLKALMQVLRTVQTDWEWGALTSVLRNQFISPTWLRGDRTAVEIDAFLQRQHLPENRAEILERLQEQALKHEDPTEREKLSILFREMQRFSELLAPATRDHTWQEWADWIVDLLTNLRISPTYDEAAGRGTPDNEAWRGWQAFVSALERIIRTLDTIGDQQSSLTFTQFFGELQELAAEISVPTRTSDRDRVRIVEISQVRNLNIPYLFLLGLTEESFPARSSESCLYGELERRELSKQGLGLLLREQHLQDEMLLFYNIVTRARRQLVLSYPQIDRRGETLIASPYLDAVRELFSPENLNLVQEGHLHPIPQRKEILGVQDLRLVAMSEALQGDAGLLGGLALIPREEEIRRNLAAAVEMNLARFHSRGFTPYEGMLQLPRNKEYLEQNYGVTREFSATELEDYATCPFRYWVSHFLELTSIDSPEIRTDPRQRGSLLHEVLSKLHTGLNAQSRGWNAEEFKTAVHQEFLRLLDEYWGGRPARGKFAEALREIEQTLLAEWAAMYSLHLDVYNRTTRERCGDVLQPLHLEVSFGHGHGAQDDRPPLILKAGELETRITGRIDRVDVLQTAQGSVYSVIDYKSGKAPAFKEKEVQAGRALQLAIYALAVEQLELAGEGAVLADAGYWSLRDQGFVSAADAPTLVDKIRVAGKDWQSLISVARRIVPQLTQDIRSGEFPPANADDNCTAMCSLKTVCRVGQIRPLSESLGKQWFPEKSPGDAAPQEEVTP